MLVRLPVPLPWLLPYADVAVLLMRLLVGAVFVTSGLSHVRDPVARGKSIGLPPGVTRFLGLAEVAGGFGVAFGILTQLAALGLILVMLGAIQKKVFVWHTGFWGKHGTDGWHYDLLFVVMCLVIATTAGGRYVLT
jgi:putative oxidoreductase